MHEMNGPYTNISLEAMTCLEQGWFMTQPVAELHALSRRAKTLPGSPIRTLLSGQPGGCVLDLGGGWPDPALFPGEQLAAVANANSTRMDTARMTINSDPFSP